LKRVSYNNMTATPRVCGLIGARGSAQLGDDRKVGVAEQYGCTQGNGGRRKAGVRAREWLSDHAIDGIPSLSSAQDLATEYVRNQSYRNDRQRIDALINWETSKNFTSGFVTGLGGMVTLPVALPAGFAASWMIQARMAAAIALSAVTT